MASEDTALFMLHEALHDLHGLSCVFRSEDDETSFDLVHAARAHIDKAVAALESEPPSPCACGGRGPLLEGWCEQKRLRFDKEPGGFVIRLAVWYQRIRPDAKRVIVLEESHDG